MTTLDVAAPETRPDASAPLGFLAIAAPIIEPARASVRQQLAAICAGLPAHRRFDVRAIEAALHRPLPDRITRMLARTLVLELRVADLRGDLAGATPQARYQEFVARMQRPEHARALFDEYSVLERLLDDAVARWSAASLAFVRDLAVDADALDVSFADARPLGALLDVTTGAGDLHRGGRSVAIAMFEGDRRVLYKPRSLAADAAVQSLLRWLDAHGHTPSFRTLRVLERGEHGWVEWVRTQPDTTAVQAGRYYRRLGGLLAVAYLLEGIDLHHENVIAAGEHPVLVDLETLFHPHLVALDRGRAHEHALALLSESVMGAGLLPQRIYGGATDTGMDVSGIGTTGEQTTPFEVPRWQAVGTSEMHLVRTRGTFSGAHNRVRVDGVATDVVAYADELVAGFTDIYELAHRERAALLAPGGPIAAFAEVETRVLLRPTRSYFRLLDESHHPDVLRDPADRDALFDTLGNAVDLSPVLARTIAAERADLWRGDIPMFTTTPSSTDLVAADGTRIVDALPESGLTRVRRRIDALDVDDLEQQRWLIAASLSTLASPIRKPASAGATACAAAPATRERLRAAAAAIADTLVCTAIHGGAGATWLGLTSLGDQGARLEPLGIDLYDGLPGLALALGQLGAALDRTEYTALARAAIVALLEHPALAEGARVPIGGFVGAGGIVYVLAHLARLWSDDALLGHAHTLVERIANELDDDDALDVVGGAAGAILGLASLWRVDPRARVREVALACGERLLARARDEQHGRAWPAPLPGSPALTGMSHGAAGIAAALLALTELGGDARHLAAARAALVFERSVFDRERGNWPDHRFGDTAWQTAWCHGAPGIALARMRGRNVLEDPELHAEIAAAVTTTLRHGSGDNHCLCHGGFGNLELLLRASLEHAPDAADACARWTATLLDELERGVPRCATKLGIRTPGLMSGLAGIALQLVRLADPAAVPSVLTLDPPAAS